MVSFLIGCVSRGWTPRCTYALLWVMLQQLHKLSPSLSLSGSCPPRSWLHIDVITILTFVLFYVTVELDEPRRAHCRIHRPVYSAFVAFYFYYNCLLCSRGWGRKMCHNHLWKKKNQSMFTSNNTSIRVTQTNPFIKKKVVFTPDVFVIYWQQIWGGQWEQKLYKHQFKCSMRDPQLYRYGSLLQGVREEIRQNIILQ